MSGNVVYDGEAGLQRQLDWACPRWRGTGGNITLVGMPTSEIVKCTKDFLYCDEVLSVITKDRDSTCPLVLSAVCLHPCPAVQFLAEAIHNAYPSCDNTAILEQKVVLGDTSIINQPEIIHRLCQPHHDHGSTMWV